MFNWIRQLLRSVFPIFLTALLASCGGGGSGSGGNTSLAEENYTGLKTQAVITEENAQGLAAGAFTGGQLGGSLDVIGLPSTVEPTPENLPVSAGMTAVTDFLVTPGPIQSVVDALSVSDSEPGECGGRFDYTINLDSISGKFTGTLDFNQYCEEGAVLDGPADFSGKADPFSETIERFTLDFDGLSEQFPDYPTGLTLFGTTTWTFTEEELPDRATLDMVVRDGATGKTSWLHDYQFDFDLDPITESGTVDLTGRYYDPGQGWIDIATPSPLAVVGDFFDPTTGVLLMTGDKGSKVRLTFLGDGTCLLEGDFDGDGNFEYQNTLNDL